MTNHTPNGDPSDKSAPAAAPAPLQSLPVYRAEAFVVTDGANFGDPLGDASDLIFDDVYGLLPTAARERLAIAIAHPDSGADFCIAQGSDLGQHGALLFLDCVATFMSPDSQTLDVIILVEVDAADGAIAAIYLQPMATLEPKTDYRLVGVDRDAAKARLAETACVSFTRGTLITLASGEQRPIEELVAGDRVLTRDSGPQVVRWIGENTLRAVGEFAPVVIGKGVLNNTEDLILSPNHRLFIYQRDDTLGVGRSEVLIKARHLVNGDTIYQRGGGFVDYFQLLFDSHQIVYAQGIAAESLLLDTRTTPALPKDVTRKLQDALNGHNNSPHQSFELTQSALKGAETADLLRNASTRASTRASASKG